MTGPDHSYCIEQVRRHDRDRYLTCLFAPADRREALFALYAFNLEVAKTAEIVSEPMIGRIRLQWWREAIDNIYAGAPAAHHVVGPLHAAIAGHGLPREPFEQLIDAREADLDGEPPATLDALESYADATSSGLLQLALDILGEHGEPARQAARYVGIAYAMAGLLRAIPFHARQKRLYLPGEVIRDAGVGIGDLFELRPSAALNAAVERVAARAQDHLARARALRAQVPRTALPALLPAALAQLHLKALRTSGYDPFAPAVQRNRPGRVWRLAWRSLRGRF